MAKLASKQTSENKVKTLMLSTKKKIKKLGAKRIVCWLLILCMVLSLIPAISQTLA